jgi:hypothetical protein
MLVPKKEVRLCDHGTRGDGLRDDARGLAGERFVPSCFFMTTNDSNFSRDNLFVV